jgi:hypothetical protein
MFNRISKLPSAIFLNLDWANSAQTPIPCAASCRQENREKKTFRCTKNTMGNSSKK